MPIPRNTQCEPCLKQGHGCVATVDYEGVMMCGDCFNERPCLFERVGDAMREGKEDSGVIAGEIVAIVTDQPVTLEKPIEEPMRRKFLNKARVVTNHGKPAEKKPIPPPHEISDEVKADILKMFADGQSGLAIAKKHNFPVWKMYDVRNKQRLQELDATQAKQLKKKPGRPVTHGIYAKPTPTLAETIDKVKGIAEDYREQWEKEKKDMTQEKELLPEQGAAQRFRERLDDEIYITAHNPYNYSSGFTVEQHRDELIDRLGKAIKRINELEALQGAPLWNGKFEPGALGRAFEQSTMAPLTPPVTITPPEPLLVGLVQSIRDPGSVWSTEDRLKWLECARTIFNLLYKTEPK